MSGHNKWSKIKRKKGDADAKKGKVFGKLVRNIELAAQNGADPQANSELRAAIEKARAANMPSTTIERAIERGKK